MFKKKAQQVRPRNNIWADDDDDNPNNNDKRYQNMNNFNNNNFLLMMNYVRFSNPMLFYQMMSQINPQSLLNFMNNMPTNNNNNINNNQQNQNVIQSEVSIPDFETIDTESNPMNKYIENAINFSYAVKHQILREKKANPDRFINIETTLSSPGLLSSNFPSKNNYKYILCLIGKILKNNGIEVGIYKQCKDKDRIDLASIQFIFSGLITKKKYKLCFSNKIGLEVYVCVINDLTYRKKFIEEWKDKISKQTKINKNLIILTNPRAIDSRLYIDLAFNPRVGTINDTALENVLKKIDIINVVKHSLLDGCRLSENIFDQNFHKFYAKKLFNQRRGGEEYIQPLNWMAYGINISGKYDFGDNTWLGNNNEEGEFAVAYYGINNLFHHNIQMIQNIMSFMGNLESGKTFMDEINIRKPGEKCMSGAYFYKNPEIAENSSEIINIGGFDYKIMFMCRINPKKIRQPENFPELWILSPTPDEIRPYKILIKKIAKSSLANASQQNIKMAFNAPPATYMQILQQKDESYFSNNNTGGSNLDYVLKQYTGSMYSYVNNYLRDGTINNNNAKDANSTVWCLHKAITQNNPNVQNGALLYRGVCKKLPNNIVVGTRFFFPEFISTSKDINVAKSFGGSGTLMYITVQNNGTNGKKVYCRDVSGISIFPEEQEIIFTSYCRFRVTKVEKSEGWDILHLVCEGHYF